MQILAPFLLILLLLVSSAGSYAAPSVAFFYGANPPMEALRAYDAVVLDPGNLSDPSPWQGQSTHLFAYVSVGEVDPARPWAGDVKQEWLKADNPDWNSRVVDLSAPGWHRFLLDRVIDPLWQRGWRGFFLDTLDSFQRFAKTDVQRNEQVAGLAQLVRAIKTRYPEAELFFNRGFEVLPQVHQFAWGVAAESLFQGWNAQTRQYVAVPEDDRAWLLGQLRQVHDSYGLPVVSIDYVAATDRKKMLATADKIRQEGVIPWVSVPELDIVGVGQRTIQPRQVLMLYDGQEGSESETSAHLYGALPFEYWGYVPVYHDIRQGFPPGSAADQYAAVVAWLADDKSWGVEYEKWLLKRYQEAVPLLFMGNWGGLSAAFLRQLGIKAVEPPTRIEQAQFDVVDSRLMGWEHKPRAQNDMAPYQLDPARGRTLLRYGKGANRLDLAAVTDWGGYVTAPYMMLDDPVRPGQMRWIVQIFEFVREAMRAGTIPMPDTTTENGLRMAFAHIDGDGFPSLAELPGNRFAAEVLHDVITRYPVPTAVSVIESEIAPAGLFPAFSGRLENAARALFRLDNVELASHTYSHPFDWSQAEQSGSAEAGGVAYMLPIKGYKFSLNREIVGSVDYINRRLAPPGKKVKLFLWSGDALPSKAALQMVRQQGLENMNGGSTSVTRKNPGMAGVYPLGVTRGEEFQVYAPQINENVYTNQWRGPFYGYVQVIDTWRLTDAPYRLKPLDIYYHTYSASKRASIKALDEVYSWALAQPLHWIWPSEWAHLARQFRSTAIAKEDNAWIIRNDGSLRTVKILPAMGYPDMDASSGVLGYADVGGVRYISLAGSGDSRLVLSPVPPSAPVLVFANARVEQWGKNGKVYTFSLQGHRPLEWAIRMREDCVVRQNGHALPSSRKQGDVYFFNLKQHVAQSLTLICP